MALRSRSSALHSPEPQPRTDFRLSAEAPGNANFATALREQRRFRTEQLAELAEAHGTDPYGSVEVVVALKRGAVHALAEIEAALARLDDGSYGSCTGCGRQINRDRLEVLPAAALCMPCQHRADVPAHTDEPGSRAR